MTPSVPARAPPTIAARIARLAVALIVAGAVLLSIGYRLGPERFWSLALVEYLPYPVHLMPALGGILISFALGWVWRVAALLSLALVLGPVMGLELNTGDEAQGRKPLRVLTYNIKAYRAAGHPDGYARLAQEIRRHRPDIVALQDANEPSVLRRLGIGPVATLTGLPYRYAFGQFTLASRFPLRECAPSTNAAGEFIDTWVRCIVDIGGREVDLYSAHLPTPRQGLNAARTEALDGVEDWEQNVAARMARARDLAKAVGARSRPVIVAGDLNAPPPSLAVRTLLDTGLRDAFGRAGVGFGYTYGHALRPGFSFLRLDHVLVSAEIGVAACTVGSETASEHRPVIADLWLPP
ncbi:MAG: endonuclease/exonuclease/phosphatase family protein [Caldimonas sp.]